MMDWTRRELNHGEHYRDLRREAEKARLVREALAGREAKRPLFYSRLSWLRDCLAAWGQRRAADRPLPSLLAVHRPR